MASWPYPESLILESLWGRSISWLSFLPLLSDMEVLWIVPLWPTWENSPGEASKAEKAPCQEAPPGLPQFTLTVGWRCFSGRLLDTDGAGRHCHREVSVGFCTRHNNLVPSCHILTSPPPFPVLLCCAPFAAITARHHGNVITLPFDRRRSPFFSTDISRFPPPPTCWGWGRV